MTAIAVRRLVPASVRRKLGRVRGMARRRALQLVRLGMQRTPPRWSGYRWVRRASPAELLARRGSAAGSMEVVHEASVSHHPLPCNVTSQDTLPDDAGWWGYSFRDVPSRRNDETLLATLHDCQIVSYRDPAKGDDFYPAIVVGQGEALDMRELRFRPGHAEVLRRRERPVERERATWILERVYHNHSHWLTAHLPKILLLREREQLDDVLLPIASERTAAMDGSLRLLGLDPDGFPTFDPERPLHVETLTVVGTDRYRPELLRLVQHAFAPTGTGSPHRRVYISRAGATRRRLVNEDEIWPLLQGAGFERVQMEELSFDEQVSLMQSTAVLAAPHGAGLTNMMFCPPGAHVVEIADLSFPNPNFYALASGLGHRYWLVESEGVGEAHPLERDMQVEPADVEKTLDRVLS